MPQPSRRPLRTVRIRIAVPGQQHALVHVSVAVVVDLVAALRRVWVDFTIERVAVACHIDIASGRVARFSGLAWISVAVTVPVGVVGLLHALVHRSVAVVVDFVADFRSSRVGFVVAIIAVLASGDCVTVSVSVPGGTIAVVVDGLVADFRSSRVIRRIGVITVTRDRHRAFRLSAGLDSITTETIAVFIDVPGASLDALVDLAVTVVVDFVTELSRFGADVRIGVVAVTVLHGEPVTIVVGWRLLDDARVVTALVAVRGQIDPRVASRQQQSQRDHTETPDHVTLVKTVTPQYTPPYKRLAFVFFETTTLVISHL